VVQNLESDVDDVEPDSDCDIEILPNETNDDDMTNNSGLCIYRYTIVCIHWTNLCQRCFVDVTLLLLCLSWTILGLLMPSGRNVQPRLA